MLLDAFLGDGAQQQLLLFLEALQLQYHGGGRRSLLLCCASPMPVEYFLGVQEREDLSLMPVFESATGLVSRCSGV